MSPDAKPHRSWEPPLLDALQVLLPAYEFIALVGRGGMGAVYQATQRSLNRPVAIKVLPADLLADADANFAARFRQEARTMAKLTHPGIVSVFESGEAAGLLYIVMEYVDGTDVARVIGSEGRLAPERVVELLTQVCDALEYAHRNGVIHRDIKPANLLLTRAGTVKIADFGLAKHQDDALLGLTRTSVAIGTPDFLAPEAWVPNTALDGRADLFALGVTLYQMLTGEVPRGFWEMPSVRVGTDDRFDAIIERALQPKPDVRYQSSSELRRDLQQIAAEPGGGGSPAVCGARRPGFGPGAVRRRVVLVLVVAATLVAGGLAAVFWPRTAKENSVVRAGTNPGGFRPLAAAAAAAAPGSAAVVSNAPSVSDAARWLLKQRAVIKISAGRGVETLAAEIDIPAGDFDIVELHLDPLERGLPSPRPVEFRVLDAVSSLRKAFIRAPELGDAGYAFLARNSGLRSLTINGDSDITDDVLAHLAGLKLLESLSLIHGWRVTGTGFRDSAWLRSVRRLDFFDCGLDDNGVRTLAACPLLENLRVTGRRVTGASLEALAASPSLTALHLCDAPGITGADLSARLPSLKRLRELTCYDMDFGAVAAAAAASLPELRSLELERAPLDDEGLAKLAGAPRLHTLRLAGTRVTPEGIAAFAQANPQCRIVR